MSEDSHNTLIIVPTYNEQDNLPGIVEALGNLPVDMLVVDDNSPDGTGDMADDGVTRHHVAASRIGDLLPQGVFNSKRSFGGTALLCDGQQGDGDKQGLSERLPPAFGFAADPAARRCRDRAGRGRGTPRASPGSASPGCR